MSVSSINSTTNVAASQLTALSSTPKPTSDTDAPFVPPGTSRFASAISDAFASIGISLDGPSTATSGTTATATTDATTDSAGTSDALGAFLQSLFAALHGQSTGSAASTDDASSGTGDPARADGVGRAHHGHGGKLEADLQSLISDLQSSSEPTTTGTDAASASTTSSATGDSALTTLEKQFDALVATSGTSSTDNSGALTTFLQTLAAGLHGAPPTGNVVSTQA